jgi:hypothetical protein
LGVAVPEVASVAWPFSIAHTIRIAAVYLAVFVLVGLAFLYA